MNAKERLRNLTRCTTKDAVRQILQKAKIKGVREDASSCPIAQYIERADDAEYANVWPSKSSASSRIKIRIQDDPFTFGRKLTKAMNSFALAFDRGEYPQLDADAKGTR